MTPAGLVVVLSSAEMERGPLIRRLVELAGWAVVAGVGLVMLTQAIGWNGTRLIAVLQSLTPYGVLPVLAVSAMGLWKQREGLATTGALVGIGAFVLSIPLVIPPGQASPIPDATAVRVAAVNLLFDNPVVADAADDLLELDPDVIVFSEYTSEHQRLLLDHPLADRYPHQINRDGRFARGMAVWSKLEISSVAPSPPESRTVDAVLMSPDGPLRVLAVHPPTPVFDFHAWATELERIGEVASAAAEPTLAVGDFNASYWHPVFRDLLRQGFADAHIAHGSGWSTSWPTDQFVQPFVRLDHALTGPGLISTDIQDFRVPGSDHTGFVVAVTLSG